MAALTTDNPRIIEANHDEFPTELPVVASGVIFDGSFAGHSGSTGNVRALVAGDNFAGISVEKTDNSTGAAGAKRAVLKRNGVLCEVAVTGAAGIGDVLASVYASSDNDLTLTSAGNSLIGKIDRYNAATGRFNVLFQALGVRSL